MKEVSLSTYCDDQIKEILKAQALLCANAAIAELSKIGISSKSGLAEQMREAILDAAEIKEVGK